MHNQDEKVILFPKWRTMLEEKSLQALEQKKYDEALSKLNELISYKINNHEIIIGKLICLMELGRYDEAQQMCKEVINYKDENYYHYVHIYLTILFQTSQYKILMDQVEYELSVDTMPEMVREQFEQLYNLSAKMEKEIVIEKSVGQINELIKATDQKDHAKQWRLIESMRKMKAEPTKSIIAFLKDEEVHPVVKTAIFQWLQDKNVSQLVNIHKLGRQLNIKPTKIMEIESHSTIKQTLLVISELEQENPTMYQLLEKLLYHYAYVRYPILPATEDVIYLAEALKIIGNRYLNIHKNTDLETNDHVQLYIEELMTYEKLYLSIIEE